MTGFHRIALGMALAGFMAGSALAQDPSGTYMRPNGDQARVWITNGKLYCRIEAGKKVGFEMCHGMDPKGQAWFGKHMKHPSMPGFMTFNGTVTSDEKTLKIKGCALGKSMCDAEVWKKVG